MEPALTSDQRIAKMGLVLPPPPAPAGAVEGIVSVLGFVNCVPWFTDQPSAIGVSSLPFGIPVEIECVALLREDAAEPAAALARRTKR